MKKRDFSMKGCMWVVSCMWVKIKHIKGSSCGFYWLVDSRIK